VSGSPDDISLEAATQQHAQGLAHLYGDPAVARQVLQLPWSTAEMWSKRLAAGADNERRVALVAVDQGQVVGHCGLWQNERVRLAHGGSLAIGVAPRWQGKGVGSRLLAAALEVADNWMALRRVELTVYIDNAPALALYRKFGFEVEGELRDYAVRDGRLANVYTMARLRVPL